MESTPFEYFQGPIDEMSDLAEGDQTCGFCGQSGPCLSLEEKGYGCFDCLWKGRFYVDHDTEIGFLSSEEPLPTHLGKYHKPIPEGFQPECSGHLAQDSRIRRVANSGMADALQRLHGLPRGVETERLQR